MDYKELKKRYKKDSDYPARVFDLEMYRRVLDGTMYDIIPYPFFKTMAQNLGSSRQSLPISQRRPSVRYRLAQVVVNDSVSFLFGEGRFPTIGCEDDGTKNYLNEIAVSRFLNAAMQDCAYRGSIGSAVIFVNVINGKIFFKTDFGTYYTPIYNPEDPDCLARLIERYKIKGKELIEKDYENIDPDKTYWFCREWDNVREIYYLPCEVSDKDIKLVEDKERTVTHNLGFVPAVWIKNLPGTDGIDGMCTFDGGIDTNIELDYQISQGGRGLKYSSEPLLLIKNMSMGMQGSYEINPGDILNVDENGDAKHVEISGDACRAVLEYCKALREIVLENTGGNRSTPEKSHGLQSGRALEMMHMALIQLASKLRISYGEHALVEVAKMIVNISQQMDLRLDDKVIPRGSLLPGKITLIWPAWFPSSGEDRQQQAVTVKTLKDARIISQETAVTTIANEYDIIDIEQEIHNIDQDIQKYLEEQQPKTTITKPE